MDERNRNGRARAAARGGVRGVLAAAFVLGACWVAVPGAEGQIGTSRQEGIPAAAPPTPPRPKEADDPPLLWNYLFAVILGLAVFGATMIPSKRGHQD